ncbi:MAG: VOC family protein [Thermoplasmata archaeon]|nr:VOC family protein [Thermoplasmata archaeon]
MSSQAGGPAFFGPILLARDFVATVSFYRGALGLPVEGAFPYAKCISTPSSFSIADGKWWAQVNGSENPFQGESSVSDFVLMVNVEDAEEVFQKLAATRVGVLSPPLARPPLGIKSLFLRDPDGRTVVLSSPLR